MKVKMISDLFKLVKKDGPNGTLYLYPEYFELASPKFNFLSCDLRSLPKGTRKGCVGFFDSVEIVFKPERHPEDYYRKKWGGEITDMCQGNMVLKEISIARALSELARYEGMRLEFEVPYGFLETPDGKRFSLFKYEPNLESSEPSEFLTSDDSKLLDKILREEDKRESFWNSLKRIFSRNADSYMFFDESKLHKLYDNHWLSELILLHNAVNHNENDVPIEYSQGDKKVCFVYDFEACEVISSGDDFRLTPEKRVAMDIDIDFLSWNFPGLDPFLVHISYKDCWFDRIVALAPKNQRGLVRAKLESGIDRMQKRLEGYFGQEITPGFIPEPGPAAKYIQLVPNLKLGDLIL